MYGHVVLATASATQLVCLTVSLARAGILKNGVLEAKAFRRLGRNNAYVRDDKVTQPVVAPLCGLHDHLLPRPIEQPLFHQRHRHSARIGEHRLLIQGLRKLVVEFDGGDAVAPA